MPCRAALRRGAERAARPLRSCVVDPIFVPSVQVKVPAWLRAASALVPLPDARLGETALIMPWMLHVQPRPPAACFVVEVCCVVKVCCIALLLSVSGGRSRRSRYSAASSRPSAASSHRGPLAPAPAWRSSLWRPGLGKSGQSSCDLSPSCEIAARFQIQARLQDQRLWRPHPWARRHHRPHGLPGPDLRIHPARCDASVLSRCWER